MTNSEITLNTIEPDIDLTIVIPFYNPGPRAVHHIKKVLDVLESTKLTFEVIAVSDGSTDESAQQIRTINSRKFILNEFNVNKGKGEAIRFGLSIGRGRYLGFIDGDGDIPAEVLLNCTELLKKMPPDIIYGSKRNSSSEVVFPVIRRIYSIGYQWLLRIFFRLPVMDTQTGMKIVKRDVINKVLPLMVESRFAFDLELFVLSQKVGFTNFVDVPVIINERFSTTVSPKAVLQILKDTFSIFYRLNFTSKYNLVNNNFAHLPLLLDTTNSIAQSRLSAEPIKDILIMNWRDLHHPKAGGSELYIHNIAREWANDGNNVIVFCSRVDGRPTREVVENVTYLRSGGKFTVYKKALKYLKKTDASKYNLIVDVINTRPFFAHKQIGGESNIAIAFQVCRELWFYQTRFPLSMIGRYVLEPAWLKKYENIKTITISESSKESLMMYGMKDVTVLPMGHTPILTTNIYVKESNPTIIFVGRLENHKRPQDVLSAYVNVKKTFPDLQVWFIGTGPLEKKLRDLRITDAHFFGKVSHEKKIELLSRAHFLVAASVREGWGLVVTEAAEVGTPSIAYSVPGLVDSIRSTGGQLCEANVESLTLAITEKLKDKVSVNNISIDQDSTTSWKNLASLILGISRN
jgi:glycosyltransferase involved in cell wall biosynthesis